MVHFPSEILHPIFKELYDFRLQYLLKEGCKNLRSCCLVNRLWCENAIPIMWSNAFGLYTENKVKAIDILVRFLDNEQRQYLTNYGVNLSNTKYLFDYPSMLRFMEFDVFLQSIFDWCNQKKLETRFYNIMLKELLKLLANHGSKLEYFSMRNVSFEQFKKYEENLNQVNISLLGEEEIKSLIVDVKDVRLPGYILEQNFTKVISENCRDLEKLITDFTRLDSRENPELLENLYALISGQRKLQKYVSFNYRAPSYSYLASLSTQSESLIKVFIQGHYFKSDGPNLEFLTKCKKLNSLTIQDCENVTLNLVEPLMMSDWPNLEYVYSSNPYSHPIQEFNEWVRSFKNKGRRKTEHMELIA
ncbi:7947_t:CDS:2 [Acaulospora morrowiae]|uniref:7947_t:CDS:1 n=1 Tax=Acaulospora morrowiae TaxID=94023 RepID=A0A9N9DDY8_9GLOM|nr:7947_t:CDS:2 [Acaulospora morrowiae]